MKVFISGGCKNGKSTLAESAACALRRRGEPLYYIATMRPHDTEDIARIKRHRRERQGKGFITFEIGTDIEKALRIADVDGTFLLDSLTALCANEMFTEHGIDLGAAERVEKQLEAFLSGVKNAVVVSDFIYAEPMMFDEYTDAYIRALSVLDRCAARVCDTVVEVCAGTPCIHKGELIV